MNKKRYCIFSAILLAAFLCGCGPKEQPEPEPATAEGTGELRAAIEELKHGTIQENSMDPYMASLDTLLQTEESKRASEGRSSRSILGSNGVFLFEKEASGTWDELLFVNGGEGKVRETLELEGQISVQGIGPVAGTDHFLALEIEYREAGDRCFLAEIDENGRKIREIPLKFTENADSVEEAVRCISQFAMDGMGKVHLVLKAADGWKYCLLSEDGELLTEYSSGNKDVLELIPVYDDKIVIWEGTEEEREIWKAVGNEASMETSVMYLDAETGKAEEVTVLEKGVYCFTLQDDRTLLYADQEGVYRRGLSEKEPEPLYLWANHEIRVEDVYAMEAGAQEIRLVYGDGEGSRYLCLKPSSGEETEGVCEITFAVSREGGDVIMPLVAEFNKQYPGCRIKIRANADETALLTELIAGKGPVLLDTGLIGFEDQEELWEPLDSVFEQLGITEDLWPAVLEAGRINDIQYGVPLCCQMITLAVAGTKQADWDYDTFLSELEEYLDANPDAEGVFNSSDHYGIYFIEDFFMHGLNDSLFWNTEKGTTDFDGERFRRVLKIARENVEKKKVGFNTMQKLLDGKIFCFEVYLSDMYNFISNRIAYGDRINYIGFPTWNGAAHTIYSWNTLAIRKTASEKEKLAAYAFLDFCVSHAMQEKLIKTAESKNLVLSSVRKDMVETSLKLLKEREESVRLADGSSVSIADYIDVERDVVILSEMYENAIARREPPVPRELLEILETELGQYFDGTITEDMLIDRLENRVGLYLNERR